MQLPTDASADAYPSVGAQMRPLAMQMMPLNASVDEEYACANAKDAEVCQCKRY